MMGKRGFSSTDHLSPEAVAAFVDHELSPAARRRAQHHIAQCQECHEGVVQQLGASQRVRSACEDGVKAPTSLVERLSGMCEPVQGNASQSVDEQTLRSRVEDALRALLRQN